MQSISPNLGGQGHQVPPGQEGVSINNVLPEEMIKEIFSRMPSSADAANACVCKPWNHIVQLLPDPTLRVFDENIWSEYLGFEVEGKIPPLPKDIYQTVRSDRRHLSGEKEAPFCTAILMPKGLTLNKLIELMGNPKKGYSTELEYINNRIVTKLGDKPIEESYWFVMTNDVIEGSRNKSYAEQKDLIKNKTNSECDLPTFLEALVCCGMHHVIYGEHLLGRGQLTYTRCQYLLNGYPVVVGGSGGLHVHDYYFFDDDDRGVSACRKFC